MLEPDDFPGIIKILSPAKNKAIRLIFRIFTDNRAFRAGL
jgi:hypothetical protein